MSWFDKVLSRTGPWLPRTLKMKDGSPLDLDAGERITRFKTGIGQGIDKWPYPPIIGYALPFMPFASAMIWGQGTALPIAGINTTLGDAFNIQNQITVPGLQKQG